MDIKNLAYIMVALGSFYYNYMNYACNFSNLKRDVAHSMNDATNVTPTSREFHFGVSQEIVPLSHLRDLRKAGYCFDS